MQQQQNSSVVSNPPKCIVNLRIQPMHFKMNLEIYQTQKVMKKVVVVDSSVPINLNQLTIKIKLKKELDFVLQNSYVVYMSSIKDANSVYVWGCNWYHFCNTCLFLINPKASEQAKTIKIIIIIKF